jgi:hypothetical protein
MASQKEHPQAQKIRAKVKEIKALDFHQDGAKIMQLLTDIEHLAENDRTRVSNW